jgi:hypothetical protein
MARDSLARLDIPTYTRYLGSSGSRTPFNLNTSYVHRTSGNGIMTRFAASSTAGLTEAYIFLDATTGTRANISLRARLYDASANNQPSTNLIATASSVTYPAADDQWIVASFSSQPSLTVGKLYCVVWDNTAAAPGTDFPGILTATTHQYVTTPVWSQAGYTTANGFSTLGTFVGEMPCIFTFASGLSIGQPYTQQATTFANNTRWRGLWLPNIAKNFEYIVYLCNSAGPPTQLRVYRSDQLPNDTPIYSRAITTDETLSQTCALSPPLTLSGSTDFYVVQNAASNSVSPNCGQIEDYLSIASVVDSMLNDNLGFCRAVQDDGSNGWTLFPWASPAGGTLIANGNIVGGGGGLRLFPGFNGGLDG